MPSTLLSISAATYFSNPGEVSVAVIGLGYVGLPLAIELAKKYNVLGFDIDSKRVDELNKGEDVTREASLADLKIVTQAGLHGAQGLHLSSDVSLLKNYRLFIITVPTPINQYKSPDLGPLLNASKMVGEALKVDDIVIFESTVYPGCTEEDCVPVLEEASGLRFNTDFYVGYSPERINPGDKVNVLTSIVKVTSGSTPEIAELVDHLYASVITAGTHKAPSIKVAEASKAIENAQRDINISFVNELALIFDRMGIDTADVLSAAGTKWNFLKYKPGLVGGHCIGVDPYYLAHKAESLGYYPQVILSGRRVNDQMGIFVAGKVVKLLIKKGHKVDGTRALILGFTFKENCPNIHNSKVIDVYNELKQFGLAVDVYDPWASPSEVKAQYGLELTPVLTGTYDAIVVAVAHDVYKELNFKKLINGDDSVIYDTKSFFNKELVDARL